MVLTESDIATLIFKKLQKEISAQELGLLQQWRAQAAINESKYLELTDFYSLQLKRKQYFEAERRAEQFALPKLAGADNHEIKIERLSFLSRGRVWIAAASIITILGFGLYFYIQSNKKLSTGIVAKEKFDDISAPAINRAMVTLQDGRQVFLDNVNDGQLAQIGSIRLVKLANGQIVYQTANGKTFEELQYNTLTNPPGSKVIDMQLSDGSRVWLNAGSAITYPVAFIGDERRVELKGEGYFEVAKDPSKKFIVLAKGTKTEVLGTHFNISAYDNEPETRITLLEGTVHLKVNTRSLRLKPGQQGIAESSSLNLQASPNLEQVMAWKEGYFNFDNMSLAAVMRELERWYAISVVYEGKQQQMIFGGNINRDINLSDVLLILERSGLKYKWNSSRRELSVSY